MRDTAAALYGFFSGFGIPAYVKDNVPDLITVNGALVENTPPYITYELREPEPLGKTALAACVWYEETGIGNIADKVDEIKTALKNGVRLDAGDGCIVLYPDTNFCQMMHDDEPKMKYAYLMFQMNHDKS